jgi:hypothetical protein
VKGTIVHCLQYDFHIPTLFQDKDYEKKKKIELKEWKSDAILKYDRYGKRIARTLTIVSAA